MWDEIRAIGSSAAVKMGKPGTWFPARWVSPSINITIDRILVYWIHVCSTGSSASLRPRICKGDGAGGGVVGMVHTYTRCDLTVTSRLALHMDSRESISA